MGGGLMQLVAYGAQDIYLTGNPQITFFKVVYRRHTNFSMESIEQTINGNVAGDSRVTSTISRNGDLVYRLFYEVSCTVKCPSKPAGTSGEIYYGNLGAAIFDNVEIEIGGQRIDRQTGQWMHVWSALTQGNSARVVSAANGTAGTLFQELTAMGGTLKTQGVNADSDATPPVLEETVSLNVKVPLQFWFCRNPGLALPLIALQYHEVKVVTTFSGLMPDSNTTKLWADYIYLDTDERRRFAQVSHEYLIEQVQFQAGAGTTTSTELNFNHPVKELIWTSGFTKTSGNNEYKGVITDLVSGKYHLKLNGHDRMAARPLNYYTKQQVWMHHTGPGDVGSIHAENGDEENDKIGGSGDGIAVYSFALKPEEHQPSGTCNFSRIDNAQLVGPNDSRDVFAVNYNVLRIMSGMGGLAYSN
jgi:hypothetical protein